MTWKDLQDLAHQKGLDKEFDQVFQQILKEMQDKLLNKSGVSDHVRDALSPGARETQKLLAETLDRLDPVKGEDTKAIERKKKLEDLVDPKLT